MKWQTVSTIPRDGTLVLAYAPHFSEYTEVTTWLVKSCLDEDWVDQCGDFVMRTKDITHWMPVPTPPIPGEFFNMTYK